MLSTYIAWMPLPLTSIPLTVTCPPSIFIRSGVHQRHPLFAGNEKIHIAFGVGQHRRVACLDAAIQQSGLQVISGCTSLQNVQERLPIIVTCFPLVMAFSSWAFPARRHSKICRPAHKQANHRQNYYSFHFFSPFLNNMLQNNYSDP